ncbi:MAG TPA: DinB family protein [Acidimicrobiales bacterium]
MPIEKPIRPPELRAGSERVQLEGWLDYHRATLLMKCAGLDTGELTRRTVLPSTLTLLGLLQHMTLVEVAWFDVVLHDSDTPFPYTHSDDGQRDRDAEFNDFTFATPEEIADTFVTVCARSRELATDVSLDDLAKKMRRDGPVDLRWIYLHMIEEYARHNGHADLLREVLDGSTGV